MCEFCRVSSPLPWPWETHISPSASFQQYEVRNSLTTETLGAALQRGLGGGGCALSRALRRNLSQMHLLGVSLNTCQPVYSCDKIGKVESTLQQPYGNELK